MAIPSLSNTRSPRGLERSKMSLLLCRQALLERIPRCDETERVSDTPLPSLLQVVVVVLLSLPQQEGAEVEEVEQDEHRVSYIHTCGCVFLYQSRTSIQGRILLFHKENRQHLSLERSDFKPLASYASAKAFLSSLMPRRLQTVADSKCL